jgi:glycosyltransferase involved in cell wall biosynthesis
MTKRVSVVIPSRHERWLQNTIDDLLKKASEDVEVIAVHDGAWPAPYLKDHPKVTQIHWSENRGMRAGINAAVAISTGDYILKADGHTLWGEGWDEILKRDCEEDWIVVPRRYSLDAEKWAIKTDKPPVDAHYLSYPFERPGDPTCSIHGTVWRERAKERKDILIDDEMSTQGSAYFMHKKYWQRIGPLDDQSYGVFTQEAQEFGLKCWLGGGRLVINKNTFYAHLHKGKQYGTGYKFNNAQWEWWAAENKKGREFAVDYWLNNRWTQRVRDFEWLIEKFWPVPSWPADWRERLEDYQRGKIAA